MRGEIKTINGYTMQYVITAEGRIFGSIKPSKKEVKETKKVQTNEEVYENFKQIMDMCNNNEVR